MKAAFALTGCALFAAPAVHAQNVTAPTQERRLATGALSAPPSGRWGLSVAGYQGYDQIADATSAPPFDDTGRLQRSGSQWGATARLDATAQRRRARFSLAGESSLLHYGAAGDTLVDTSATLGQDLPFGRNVTLSLGETLGYSPFQSLGLFPGFGFGATTDVSSTVAPTFQQGFQVSQVLRYNVTSALTAPVSARTRVRVDYQRAASFSEARLADTTFQETGVRMTRQVSRNVGLQLGYAYGQTSQQQTMHHVRLGFDGRKPLSRSRRTIASFGTDTVLVKRPRADRAPASELRLLGHADLDHYVLQTWSLRVSYRRDVTMLQGYAFPVFRDAVTTGIAGNVTRRLGAGLNGAIVQASFAEVSGDRSERALTGTAWIRLETSRRLTLFAEYVRYAHNFETAPAELGLPPRFSRNTVRGGLVYRLERAAEERPQ